jgi:two-component system cell cycle response regulator CpdR
MTAAYTILLVDDEEAVREPRAKLLSLNGFRMLVAQDGDEVLRLLGQEHVDVLFTDIAMPRLNGIELARQATLLRRDLKIIFMTGYDSRAAEAKELAERWR